MGSFIEVNDTLQITVAQGFPADVLDLAKHEKSPVSLSAVAEQVFSFCGKTNPRIFHLDPVRVYLVENRDGKWIFWGKAAVQSQTITKKLDAAGAWIPDAWETSGTFKIIELYEPDYQRLFTRRESPLGKSFF